MINGVKVIRTWLIGRGNTRKKMILNYLSFAFSAFIKSFSIKFICYFYAYITRTGRFHSKSSLDELPQAINILYEKRENKLNKW